MSIHDFLFLWLGVLASMLACRCIPLFALRDRKLSQRTEDVLSLIPVAAFAALVANDLFSPNMFAEGMPASLVPLLAAALVVLVSYKTKSLIWAALSGTAAFALLELLLK